MNIAAPLAEVAEIMRLVFVVDAATKFPEAASWMVNAPYGFSGRAPHIGLPLGLGRVPIKYSSFVKVCPVPVCHVSIGTYVGGLIWEMEEDYPSR